jgi:hypothetical protein
VRQKICRTNWLIQIFFGVQIASSRAPRRVQYFCPYSALDFFEFAKASPLKICLDYEQNYCIKNSAYLLVR